MTGKSLIISFVVLSSFFAYGGFYPENTEDYQKKISDHIKRKSSNSPNVYFLRDNHSKDQTQIFLDLTKEIQKNNDNLDCILLELPGNYFQSAIDHYLSTGLFDELRQANVDIFNKYKVVPPESGISEKKALFQFARDHSLKVFAIDQLPELSVYTQVRSIQEVLKIDDKDEYRDELRQFITYHFGHKRNHYMSHKISELMETQECQLAVSVNGYSHFKNKGRLSKFEDTLVQPMQLILNKEYDIPTSILITE